MTGTQQVPGPVTACRAQHVPRAQPWQSLPSDCALFTSDLGMIEHCWLLSLSAAPPRCLSYLLTTFLNLQHWFYISLTLLNPRNCSRARISPPKNQLTTTPACVNLTLLKCCLLYQNQPRPGIMVQKASYSSYLRKNLLFLVICCIRPRKQFFKRC